MTTKTNGELASLAYLTYPFNDDEDKIVLLGPLCFYKRVQVLRSAPRLHVTCFSKPATHIVDKFITLLFYKENNTNNKKKMNTMEC